ncbi:luciferase family protein [Aerosakkonemataceae cyanobacterium BLCC-F50]|uniref:Luciferase family protein n=1 Tax=Floridaenema flaviceps BLCC-F50 TaxID=3153642 RepID=A0ABV4Y241_9CYAN
MKTTTISQAIADTVSTWKGVTIAPHRFGGIEFRVNNREFGHLHGDYQADIPFSARLRKELVASQKVSEHHLYPNSGWVSFYIRSADDVPALIELLKLNYDRLTAYSNGHIG